MSSRNSRFKKASQGPDKGSTANTNTNTYPKSVLSLVQNAFPKMGMNPKWTGEQEFGMVWNAILNTHFPAHQGYGITFHRVPDPKSSKDKSSSLPSGSGTTFLVVKLINDAEESTVLVCGLRGAGEDTATGREKVEEATWNYVHEPGFDETEYGEMYTISSVGLSWAAHRLEEGMSARYVEGDEKPETVVDWSTNMTSAISFEKIKDIAEKVQEMAHPYRRGSKEIKREASNVGDKGSALKKEASEETRDTDAIKKQGSKEAKDKVAGAEEAGGDKKSEVEKAGTDVKSAGEKTAKDKKGDAEKAVKDKKGDAEKAAHDKKADVEKAGADKKADVDSKKADVDNKKSDLDKAGADKKAEAEKAVIEQKEGVEQKAPIDVKLGPEQVPVVN